MTTQLLTDITSVGVRATNITAGISCFNDADDDYSGTIFQSAEPHALVMKAYVVKNPETRVLIQLNGFPVDLVDGLNDFSTVGGFYASTITAKTIGLKAGESVLLRVITG